jgi:hypothetical protein
VDEYLKNIIKDTPLENHEIWTKYKSITLHVKTAFIFHAGAGGHFLGQFVPNVRSSYINKDQVEYEIDAKVLYSDIDRTNLINDIEHDLDFITEVELLTLTMAIQAEEWGYNYDIYMDHKFPYLLSQIYNLKIDKILYIDPQDCYFYISALDTCKTLFSPIQKKGQHQLKLILNRAIQEGSTNRRSEYKISELQFAKLETNDTRGEYIHYMSPFLILYVLESNKGNPITSKNFIKFGKGMFSRMWMDKEPKTDYLKYTYNYFKQSCNNFHSVSYYDLFFNLKIAEIFNCNKEDVNNIIEYNTKNIDMLIHIKDFIIEPHNNQISKFKEINHKNHKLLSNGTFQF